MIVIRTAEDMARLLAAPLDPDLRSILQNHLNHLDGYDLAELGRFVVCQPGDTLADIDAACGWPLLSGECLASPAEVCNRKGQWLDLVFVLSDDGFGVVLIVPMVDGTDPALLTACHNEVIRSATL